MFTIKKLKNTLLLVSCLVLLLFTANCRHYQQDYMYIPPENDGSRECIVACQTAKRDCDSIASKGYQECLREADRTSMLNYNIDLSNKNTSSVTTRKMLTMEECRNFSKQCQANYNACYIDCGGKVEPTVYSNVGY